MELSKSALRVEYGPELVHSDDMMRKREYLGGVSLVGGFAFVLWSDAGSRFWVLDVRTAGPSNPTATR